MSHVSNLYFTSGVPVICQIKNLITFSTLTMRMKRKNTKIVKKLQCNRNTEI